MNILIIENEIYLAQKVVSRLLDDGHSCDYIESPNIDNLTKDYDTILLSTSLPSALCKNIIKKYSENSIILLLVSYISDETVTNPIKDGAKDYIMKPFIMDELIRKIYHYKDFRSLKRELETLREYFDFTMADIDTTDTLLPPSFPTLIESNSQKCADKLVFELSRKMDLPINFISLTSALWQKQVNAIQGKSIIYLTDYHTLKKNIKENVIAITGCYSKNDTTGKLIGFVTALVTVWIVVYTAGIIVSKIFSASGLGVVDRIFGFIFGASKVFLIFSIVFVL